MSADTILGEAFAAMLALGVSVAAACRVTGRSRASHYRRRNPPERTSDPVLQAERAKPPGTLTVAERARVLEVINWPAYQDLSSARSGPGNWTRTGTTARCPACTASPGRPAGGVRWSV